MTHSLHFKSTVAVCTCSDRSNWSYTPCALKEGHWDNASRKWAELHHALHVQIQGIRLEQMREIGV